MSVSEKQAVFESNSINFEDVMLNRLFPTQRRGFYVDVGAGHPQIVNDLFALYDRGWSGINVEPNEQFFALHQQIRPRDQNLCMALSDTPGEMTYYQIEGSGLSTCDGAQANAHAAGGHVLQARSVPVGTLADILTDAGIRQFDILKVDVEGFEEKVLSGNDWERFRPSVVLVEATFPNSPERKPTNIRGFMEQRGYRHVLFDGLNDFYLEHSFPEPPGFTLPPNIFDNFIPRDVGPLRRQVESLQANFAAAESYAHTLEASRAEMQAGHGRAIGALEQKTADAEAESSSALAAADALATENRRLQQQVRSQTNETRRLRAAADQMRSEITVLSRMLEPLHIALEQSSQVSRDHADRIDRLRADMAGTQAAMQIARDDLRIVYASRSWQLTEPWRLLGRMLKRLKR